ncbi:MAG: DUF432 domain-containing protein [Candidatus Nezhaarchaeales archaeon]
MIYGSSLSPQVISRLREEGISLKLESCGALTIYQREGGFPGGPLRKVVAAPREGGFSIYPVHSTQPEVSTNLLLRLSSPVVVAPRSTVEVYVRVPISAGVYVLNGGAQVLIDSFSRHPYKYALYGPAASGVVCRFYRTDAYLQVPEGELWSAVTKLVIENDSDSFREVRNVVLPALNTMVYVDGRGAAYVEAVRLRISRDGLGDVSLENRPPLEGLRECPQQFGRLQERAIKFLMEFGL